MIIIGFATVLSDRIRGERTVARKNPFDEGGELRFGGRLIVGDFGASGTQMSKTGQDLP